MRKNALRSRLIAFIFMLAVVFLSFAAVFAGSVDYNAEDVFENHGTVFLIIDVESGKILDANKAAGQFYGYTYDELVNMNINQINTLTDSEIKTEMNLATAQKRNYFVFQHRLKDGTVKDVEVYSYPFTGSQGNKILYSIIHDITPRINAEKEASSSKQAIIILLSMLVITLILAGFYQNKIKKKEIDAKIKLQTLFDNMKEGFALHEIICDEQGIPVDYRFLEVNRAFEDITGLKGEVIRNRTVRDVLPGTEPYWIEFYGKVALNGESTTFTNYAKDLDKHFHVNVYSPQIRKFVTVFTDITSIKRLESTLVNERALFEATLHSLGDGVISTDINGRIELMNAAAQELTGWTLSEAKGLEFDSVFNLAGKNKQKDSDSPVKQVLETGMIIEPDDYSVMIRKDAVKIPVEYKAAPIKDEKERTTGVVLVFRDYTDKKEKEERITYLSYHDQLTGLYNRRFFEEELRRLDTERNLPFTIAMIDVNGLKLTNDAFGHLAGDELLRRVANVLKKECRLDDIIARIGGDEFVILLPKTSSDNAELLVNRIHNTIALETFNNIMISVSIGWETKESTGQGIMDVYIKAEEYMYRKKLTESRSMRSQTIQAILKTINRKVKSEKLHSERAALLSRRIGQTLDLNYETLKEIEMAARMHDIGKISINESILNKAGRLTESEYEEMKRHAESGYHILKSVDEYSKLADYVLAHHERWDGSGYPRGLSGKDIPLISRIISVAEAVESMISDRPYRKAMSREDVVNELLHCAGKHFDPEIVNLFIENCIDGIDGYLVHR